jgi:hypothetical protein
MKSQRPDPFTLRLLRLALAAVSAVHGGFGAIRDWLQHQIALQSFTIRSDDVFLVTYPKSGTTLLQMMLYQLTSQGEMDFPHIDSISPWFERELAHGWPQNLEVPSPRFFKSHLRFSMLPRGARSIYLARDPGDILVSAYHHYCLITGMSHDFERFADAFLAGRVQFGSWFEHMRSWWPHRHDPEVLFLRYEEVVADLPGTARKIAGFCGLDLDERDLPRIVERCSLAFMKHHPEKFDPRLRQIAQHREEFVRQGQVGEGVQRLSARQREHLERKVGDLAYSLGCSPTEILLPSSH